MNPLTSVTGNSLKLNVLANFTGRIWTSLLSIIFIPLYIRILGIESFGLIGFFVTLQPILTVMDLGLSTALNREMARLSVDGDRREEKLNLLRTIEVFYWALAFLVVVVIQVGAPLAAHYWIRPDHLPAPVIEAAIRLMGLIMAFQFMFSLYQGGLLGIEQQVSLNIILIVSGTLKNVGIFAVLYWISPTIEAFFIWQLVISIFQTVAGRQLLVKSISPHAGGGRFDRGMVDRIWHFAAGMTALSLVTVFLTHTDKIILSTLLTLEKFGYYTVASGIAACVYIIVGPVSLAAFPRFSQLAAARNEKALSETYHSLCQCVSIMVFPLMAVVAGFSREVLTLWTQNALLVDHTHLLLTLLIIGSGLNAVMNIPYQLQLAYGWTKLAFSMNVAALSILIPALIYLTLHYGPLGAAIVWIILNTGYVIVGIQVMHSAVLRGEQWRWYLQDTGIPAVLAMLIVVISRTLMPSHPSPLFILGYLAGTWLIASALAAGATPLGRAMVHQRINAWREARTLA